MLSEFRFQLVFDLVGFCIGHLGLGHPRTTEQRRENAFAVAASRQEWLSREEREMSHTSRLCFTQ